MADFQSFLFQNMQMIGLEEEEANESKPMKTISENSGNSSDAKKANSTKAGFGINNKPPNKKENSNNKKIDSNSVALKSLGNISVSTTETFLSCLNGANKNETDQNSDEHDTNRFNKKYPIIAETNGSLNSTTSSASPPSTSPKVIRRSSMTNSNENDDDLNDSNNYHLKSIEKFKKISITRKNKNEQVRNSQTRATDVYLDKKDNLFETNITHFESNLIEYNEFSRRSLVRSRLSSRNLSSPESVIKNDFKSSTPIGISIPSNSKFRDSVMSHDYEREIKSPNPINTKSNKLNSQRRFSSNESISFKNRNKNRNLSNDSINNDKTNSNYQVNSRMFNKKHNSVSDNSLDDLDRLSINMQKSFLDGSRLKHLNDLNNEDYDNEDGNEDDLNKQNNDYDDEEENSLSNDNNLNSIESTLMEPYLVKFEEEILKSSKSDMIRDFNNFKNSEKLKNGEGHYLKRYINEIKNLTIRRKKSNADSKSKPESVEKKPLNLLELRKMTKTQIPWNNLDIDSADLLLSSISDSYFGNGAEIVYPDIYSKNGNKISRTQVKKWFKILEKLTLEQSDIQARTLSRSISRHSTKMSSKQYFINKKKQILDKVSLRKKSKTFSEVSNASEISKKLSSDISRSASKLYANCNVNIDEQLKKNLKNESKKSLVDSKTKKSVKSNVDETLQDDDCESINTSQTLSESESVKSFEKRKTNKTVKAPERKEKLNDSSQDFDLKKRQKYTENQYVNDNFNIKAKNEPNVEKEKLKKNISASIASSENHFYNEINENSFDRNKNRKANEESKSTIKTTRKSELTERETRHTRHHTNTMNSSSSSRIMETKHTKSEKSIADLHMKLTQSNVSIVPPLPEFSDPTRSNFKRPITALSKLKSPERKILYNEWFTIIKKMEKDPKFDLEALVRTRGRFTEHERISYRDKLLIKQQQLRCARSEPNFGAMLFLTNGANSETGTDPDTLKASKSRSGLNTTPSKGKNDPLKLKRNLSAHDKSNVKDNTIKSESFSETIRRTWELDNTSINSVGSKANKFIESTSNLSNALKLTLQKSDINLIKEVLKKKDKKIISELSNRANEKKAKPKSPSSSPNPGEQKRSQFSNDNLKTTKTNRLKMDIKNNTIEECDVNDDDEDEANPHSTNRKKSSSHHTINNKQIRNNTTTTSKNNDFNKNHQTLNNKTRQHRNMHQETGHHHEAESKLMSKCKNLTNQIYKSESAKAICDELKLVKGKIGSKLKILTNNTKSSSKIQASENEKSLIEEKSRSKTNSNSESKSNLRNGVDMKLPSGRGRANKSTSHSKLNEIFDDKSNLKSERTIRQRSSGPAFSVSSEDLSENENYDESSKHNQKNSDREKERARRARSSRENLDVSTEENTRDKRVSSNHKALRTNKDSPSHDDSHRKDKKTSDSPRRPAVPARPPPPKRPPPPRPTSPSVSFSNYTCTSYIERNDLKKEKRHKKESESETSEINEHRRRDRKGERRHESSRDASRNISASPSSKRSDPKLPPRPPLPPSKQKKGKESNKKEEFLSDCQIYELEELKLRNGKSQPSRNKNLGLIKEEQSKSSSRDRSHRRSSEDIHDKRVMNSSTPSLSISRSPTPTSYPTPPLPPKSSRNMNQRSSNQKNQRQKHDEKPKSHR